MESAGILCDLAVVFGAALGAGLVSSGLRQPVLVGYLLAGMAIGPHGLGWIGDERSVSQLAELGVIMLMFALGVEFSLAHFKSVRRLVLVGGLAYMAAATGLTAAVCGLLGLGVAASLALGFVVTLSSTVVVMQLLIERGEVETLHGRTMLGWLILQDLAVVPMLVVMPVLATAGGMGAAVWPLALALIKVALFLGATWALGTTILPRMLDRMAHTRRPELFSLTVVALCLGTAAVSAGLGLSLALGAFLAGLVVSESDDHRRVLAEVLPLRDLFVTLFFVSVGMLLDPAFAGAHLGSIALLAGVIVVAKAALGVVVARGLRIHWPGALTIGLGLAQIGEFSFVVAREAHVAGLIDAQRFDMFLAAAFVTMIATPTLLRGAKAAARHAEPAVTITRAPEAPTLTAASPDHKNPPGRSGR